MPIVNVSNLKKSYNKLEALKSISFSIDNNMIYGLLGPNGSGKSTIINILSGLLTFNSGNCSLFDLDLSKKKNIVQIQKNLGVVPQDYSLYEDLRAKENVEFFGRLYGLWGSKLKDATKEALSLVDLWDYRNAFPTSFSGGMKRRLNIACSIIHKPKLIIMDEPTASLDPISRDYILNTVKTLNNYGCTIIYTSHYLGEIDELCHKALIINKGEVLSTGTPLELRKLIPNKNKIKITLGQNALLLQRDLSNFSSNYNLSNYNKFNTSSNIISIECDNVPFILEKLLHYLKIKNINILDIEITKNSLEDVFMHLLYNPKNLK